MTDDRPNSGMTERRQQRRPVTYLEIAPRIAAAAGLCSASIIEFTVPQIIKLSAGGAQPLPTAQFTARMAIFGRAIFPQTAITATQFLLVRELTKVLDSTVGPQPINLSIAYGVASVPLISAKYNLLTADTFAQFGRKAPAEAAHSSHIDAFKQFWRQKIKPGLFWSYLRDSGSTGGAIVLGPMMASFVSKHLNEGQTAPGPALKFATGLFTGSITGFCTQFFHNAALTAGRMAEMGETPGNMQAMRAVLKEHGSRAFYLNFQYRVAIIAFWSAVLNVTAPFQDYEYSYVDVDIGKRNEL